MRSEGDRRQVQVGILEIVFSLAVLVAVMASIAWRLDLDLIGILVVLTMMYWVLRDFRKLWL